MTTLQPSSNITDSAATQGAAKSFLANIRLFVSSFLGTDSADQVGALMGLGTILNSSLLKAGAYTVVKANRGQVICCNGTFTLGVDAAITLGDGFAFGVFNYGSGTITIDPYLNEWIDGATTKTLAPGKLAIVYCNGTRFASVGSIATGSGSGLDADLLDGQHGSYYAPASGGNYVSKDVGSGAVGSFASYVAYGFSPAKGSTYAGSSIAMGSGTWLCLSAGVDVCVDASSPLYAPIALFQRIA